MDIQKQEHSELRIHDTAFVLPFSALDRDSLALAGGKDANLGEMASAGFPVPPGFCITTGVDSPRQHREVPIPPEIAEAIRFFPYLIYSL